MAFGRHIQAMHPEWANFEQNTRRAKRVVKTLQAIKFAKEKLRFERQGLRRISLKKFDDKTLDALGAWLRKIERDPTANLMLSSIRFAEDGFPSNLEYRKMVRALTSQVESGIQSGVYVVTEKKTYVDPRIALEVLKIMYAFGQGWSVAVHILLLYGVNAFVEQLNRDGVHLPIKVRTLPEPGPMLRHEAKDVLDLLEPEER